MTATRSEYAIAFCRCGNIANGATSSRKYICRKCAGDTAVSYSCVQCGAWSREHFVYTHNGAFSTFCKTCAKAQPWACPKCGLELKASMSHKSGKFWGCSQWPRCSGSRDWEPEKDDKPKQPEAKTSPVVDSTQPSKVLTPIKCGKYCTSYISAAHKWVDTWKVYACLSCLSTARNGQSSYSQPTNKYDTDYLFCKICKNPAVCVLCVENDSASASAGLWPASYCESCYRARLGPLKVAKIVCSKSECSTSATHTYKSRLDDSRLYFCPIHDTNRHKNFERLTKGGTCGRCFLDIRKFSRLYSNNNGETLIICDRCEEALTIDLPLKFTRMDEKMKMDSDSCESKPTAKDKVKKIVKADAEKITYRIAADRSVQLAQKAVLKALKESKVDGATLSFVKTFLGSPWGAGFLSIAAGAALTAAPAADPRLGKLAEELRVAGGAKVGNLVIDALWAEFGPNLTGILASLPAEATE